MLTEQEALAIINDKIKNNTLKPESEKYINKLKELEDLQNKQQKVKAELQSRLTEISNALHKTKGAISVVLEMAVEEEGLLEPK